MEKNHMRGSLASTTSGDSRDSVASMIEQKGWYSRFDYITSTPSGSSRKVPVVVATGVTTMALTSCKVLLSGRQLLVVGVVAACFVLGKFIINSLRNLSVYSSSRSPKEVPGDRQAVEADLYSDTHEDELSSQEREARVKQNYEEKPNRKSIQKGTHFHDREFRQTCRDVNNDFNDPDNVRISKEEEENIGRQVYIEVPLSEELFPYTGAILINRPSQGLLHTFARHHDQWNRAIGLETLMEQLPVIVRAAISQVQQVTGRMASDYSYMQSLFQTLENAIESSTYPTGKPMIKPMSEISSYLHNTVQGTYIGDYVYEGGLRHLFRVERGMVLAVAVSRELYIVPNQFDGRPFRTIPTAFFMNESAVRKSENFVEYKSESGDRYKRQKKNYARLVFPKK